MPSDFEVLLGSRSPQRLQLLSLLFPRDRIRVAPPLDADEPGFSGISTFEEICRQLQAIASRKLQAVLEEQRPFPQSLVITADTTIVAQATDGRYCVLEKPDGPNWQQIVRSWFRDYYFGRVHQVATAVSLRLPDALQIQEFVSVTDVRFRPADEALLDWYLQTEEPLGKAGGYGLQGAGGMFVESVHGSLSNVIGLPVEKLWQVCRELQ
ncbi:Maf family protein [Planctomicrobium sp. SH664]|uniref:Maf family protein n=1 Tax=Planctomicrobium sp. SH664 TaxID=3448125 RepID=UPI003F5CB11D